MGFEYKCVGAPERPKRQRGVRSRSDRVALAMQEVIAAEAVDGWEYLRTDLVPVEEKAGFFSRAHEVHRAVLVFRRDFAASRAARVGPGRELSAGFEPPAARAEPQRQPDPQPEPREGRIALSAERDAPPPPPRPTRPPSGLG